MSKQPPEPNLPKPTTPKGQATLARILASGRETFGESGYVSMRMSDLAQRAKLSMGALYRYFDNKDDVFLAIIHSIHNELYMASRSNQRQIFGTAPFEAILQANRGYLSHYCNHRKVMRAFVEATMVDQRYNEMWSYMRERHIVRVVSALEREHNITTINGLGARITVEALASMTEQSAFVWYANTDAGAALIPVDDAAKIVSNIWYKSIF